MSTRPVLTGLTLTVGDDVFEFEAHPAAVASLKAATAAVDAGHDVFACGWLVESYTHPGRCDDEDEFGCGGCEMLAEGPRVVECGAVAVGTERGFTCLAGHGHVRAEVRHNEGWDYFEDDEFEAARNGRFLPAVEMVRVGSGRA